MKRSWASLEEAEFAPQQKSPDAPTTTYTWDFPGIFRKVTAPSGSLISRGAGLLFTDAESTRIGVPKNICWEVNEWLKRETLVNTPSNTKIPGTGPEPPQREESWAKGKNFLMPPGRCGLPTGHKQAVGTGCEVGPVSLKGPFPWISDRSILISNLGFIWDIVLYYQCNFIPLYVWTFLKAIRLSHWLSNALKSKWLTERLFLFVFIEFLLPCLINDYLKYNDLWVI